MQSRTPYGQYQHEKKNVVTGDVEQAFTTLRYNYRHGLDSILTDIQAVTLIHLLRWMGVPENEGTVHQAPASLLFTAPADEGYDDGYDDGFSDGKASP